MEWLNKRLYTTKEEQDTWSSDNWFAVLSQIMKFFNDAMMILTEDRVKSEKDEKTRHSLEIMYKRKVYAENEIKSWDLSKMTYTIKAIMKADLMQRQKYHKFLREYTSLKPLDEIERLTEPLYLRKTKVEPFMWYDNMNIHL